MRFIELTIEGVPGTRAALRFPFDSNLNVLQQKGTLRLTTVIDLIQSLLFPTLGKSNTLGPAKSQKANLVFEARGNVYRVERDYIKAQIFLFQLEQGSKDSFRELSKEFRYIKTTLERSLKMPTQRIFRSLLVSRISETLDKEEPTFRLKDSPLTQAQSDPVHEDPHVRLAGLKEDLRNSILLSDLGASLDELQSSLFKVEEQLNRFKEPKRKLKEIEDEYEPYKVFDNPGVITSQTISKLKSYENLKEKKEQDLLNLEERSSQAAKELSVIPLRPVIREPIAIIGTVLTLGGFIGASFLREYGWAFSSSLLIFILGLFVIGSGLLKGMKREQKIAALRKQLTGMNAEKAGIEKRFEIENTVVKNLFETIGNNDPLEIQESMARRKALLTERELVEQELTSLEKKSPFQDLILNKEKLQSEIVAIESRLADIPPLSIDSNALEREIAELEVQLQEKTRVLPNIPSLREEEDSDVTALLDLTSQVMDRTRLEVLKALKQGASKNISVLTLNKFEGIEVQGEKIVAFRTPSGVAKWETLDTITKATLLFAIQFTCWQLLVSSNSILPLFLDMVSSQRPELLSKMVLQAAQVLARKTQVLVLSA